MSELQVSQFTHDVFFSAADFEKLNNYPRHPERQSTMEELAVTAPLTAYSLLVRFLTYKPKVMPRAAVQCELGVITTPQDGPEVARGILLRELKNNFVGGAVLRSTTVTVYTYTMGRHVQGSGSEPTIVSVPQFSIDARPPELTT